MELRITHSGFDC